MLRSPASLSALVPMLALVLASHAVAQEIPRRASEPVDTWSDPNPGVRYLRRTIEEPSVAIHALVIDTRVEGVRVIATPREERWGTVSDFAQTHRAAAAINGGFWGLFQRPTGVTAGGGALWDGAEPDPDFGHFGVQGDGRAVVFGPGEGEDARSLARLTDAASGRPVLVGDGEVLTEVLDAFETSNQRQPRTAIGVSADARTIVIAVADGRQDHSHGLTLYQLARLMRELGAHAAINLDGGGSSTMYVERAGGIVSSPSRGRWVRALGLDESDTRRVRTEHGEREVYVRGVEREVMNQIAVLAPAPQSEVPVQGTSALADGLEPPLYRSEANFVAPTGAPLRLGVWREALVPAAWIGAPIVSLGVLGLLVRRVRRRGRSPTTSRVGAEGAAG